MKKYYAAFGVIFLTIIVIIAIYSLSNRSVSGVDSLSSRQIATNQNRNSDSLSSGRERNTRSESKENNKSNGLFLSFRDQIRSMRYGELNNMWKDIESSNLDVKFKEELRVASLQKMAELGNHAEAINFIDGKFGIGADRSRYFEALFFAEDESTLKTIEHLLDILPEPEDKEAAYNALVSSIKWGTKKFDIKDASITTNLFSKYPDLLARIVTERLKAGTDDSPEQFAKNYAGLNRDLLGLLQENKITNEIYLKTVGDRASVAPNEAANTVTTLLSNGQVVPIMVQEQVYSELVKAEGLSSINSVLTGNGIIQADALSAAVSAGLMKDIEAASAWYESIRNTIASKAQDVIKATFARHAQASGDEDTRRQWIESIVDRDTKTRLLGELKPSDQ